MITKFIRSAEKKTWVSVAVCLALTLLLIALPTSYEMAGAAYRDREERVPARVLSTDDSTIKNTGLVRSGEQRCQVELLGGTHKGETFSAANLLSGSLEQDKIRSEERRVGKECRSRWSPYH